MGRDALFFGWRSRVMVQVAGCALLQITCRGFFGAAEAVVGTTLTEAPAFYPTAVIVKRDASHQLGYSSEFDPVISCVVDMAVQYCDSVKEQDPWCATLEVRSSSSTLVIKLLFIR